MITPELSSAHTIGRTGATILAVTQKNTRRVTTLPAEYEYRPELLSSRVMLQFGDKAAAEKNLVDDGRSKTASCARALRFCRNGVSGSDLRRRADHRGATLQAQMEKPRSMGIMPHQALGAGAADDVCRGGVARVGGCRCAIRSDQCSLSFASL